MGGVLTVTPGGFINYTGRQQVPGLLTSRDLYGTECATCGGAGALKIINARGNAVGNTDCPDCDGQGYTQD